MNMQQLTSANLYLDIDSGIVYQGRHTPDLDSGWHLIDTEIPEFFSSMSDEDYKLVCQALPNHSHLTKYQMAYLVEMDRLTTEKPKESDLYQYLSCRYRDGANYKSWFYVRIKVGGTFTEPPEEGDEQLTMQQLGYGESKFITEILKLDYDSEYDHNSIDVLKVYTDAKEIEIIESRKNIDTLVEVD